MADPVETASPTDGAPVRMVPRRVPAVQTEPALHIALEELRKARDELSSVRSELAAVRAENACLRRDGSILVATTTGAQEVATADREARRRAEQARDAWRALAETMMVDWLPGGS